MPTAGLKKKIPLTSLKNYTQVSLGAKKIIIPEIESDFVFRPIILKSSSNVQSVEASV